MNNLSENPLEQLFLELDKEFPKFKEYRHQPSKKILNSTFSKMQVIGISNDLLLAYLNQKKISNFLKYFIHHVKNSFQKTNKDPIIYAFEYLSCLLKFSNSSKELSFILGLFSFEKSLFLEIQSYLKTKKFILENIHGNNFSNECLDEICLNIEQWISVANKFFSGYDIKNIIDQISHQITVFKHQIDKLPAMNFIGFCIQEFLSLKQKEKNHGKESNTIIEHYEFDILKMELIKPILKNKRSISALNEKKKKIQPDKNLEQIKNELKLEKEEKKKLIKDNKILETFLEELIVGYNRLLSYTFELEKSIGFKKGKFNNESFIQDIEKLSLYEDLKDSKAFNGLFKNVQDLLKMESQNELPMLSSIISIRGNEFPEECPEECPEENNEVSIL